jgi:hypothetical protein
MSGESLQQLIRECIPQPDITDDRLERLIDGALRRTERPSPVRRWSGWFPLLQYALPMIAAIFMGVSVGSAYADDWPVAQLSSLILSPLLITGES